jgi:hypothetical protein
LAIILDSRGPSAPVSSPMHRQRSVHAGLGQLGPQVGVVLAEQEAVVGHRKQPPQQPLRPARIDMPLGRHHHLQHQVGKVVQQVQLALGAARHRLAPGQVQRLVGPRRRQQRRLQQAGEHPVTLLLQLRDNR